MNVRLIPEDGKNPYASHPGFDAQGCPCQYTVTPAYRSTSHHGFGCGASGGHCLPGEFCDKRREEHAEWMRFNAAADPR
jgi:hypothetical protein